MGTDREVVPAMVVALHIEEFVDVHLHLGRACARAAASARALLLQQMKFLRQKKVSALTTYTVIT